MQNNRQRLTVYDHPQVEKTFVNVQQDGNKEAALSIEGLHCGSCVKRCENGLAEMQGLVDFQINLSTRRAILVWNPAHAQLSMFLQKLDELGFPAYPYNRDQVENNQRQLRNQRHRG